MASPSRKTNDFAPDYLDPSTVDDLARIMDSAALRTLLCDVVADIEQRLERIAQGGSLRQIRQDAHDLKSMGGNFGLLALSEAAAAIERDARTGAADAVQGTVPGLLETGRVSVAALSQRYALKRGGGP